MVTTGRPVMCELEAFEDTFQGDLESCVDYASQICYELAIPMDGKGLCERIKDAEFRAAREDRWLADRYLQRSAESRRVRLRMSIERAAHALLGHNGPGVADPQERDEAIERLRRVKDGLDPRGCFALAVCVIKTTPEELGRNWLREGFGAMGEAIERELGRNAWALLKRYLPYWREAEGDIGGGPLEDPNRRDADA